MSWAPESQKMGVAHLEAVMYVQLYSVAGDTDRQHLSVR